MGIKNWFKNWLLADEIKAIKDQEQEMSEVLDISRNSESPSINEKNLTGYLNAEVDEFGCERLPGERVQIGGESYVLDPICHELIPYGTITEALKKSGMWEKYRLAEDFSDAAVTAEILQDFMGFYGGSHLRNNYFEWTYVKQRLMFERSHEECQKGIGKAIKDITTNFVIGDGIGFEYTDIKVEDKDLRENIYSTLWKIWQDNNFDQKQYTIADFAVERGEVFIKIYLDEVNGYMVEVIDPWEIIDYLYDPITKKVKVWFRNYYRNGQPIVREPLLEQGGIDPYTDCPYIVHHYKFNVADTIVRGRSDIYSVLYWIKIYNDFLKCRSRVNRFRSSVAWHKQIEGGTKSISAGATKVQKPFPPGTVLVTDAKTTYKAIEAKIQAGDVKDDGDAFKIMIASATQIPHHWLFGDGSNTNLATAKNMSAVPKRKFMRRQKDLKNIITEIFWRGLQFYLDPKSKGRVKNSIKATENTSLDDLKESIRSYEASLVDFKKSNDVPFMEESFNYKGATIKRKHLEITIPNIDEHNAEDLMKLVTCVKNLRSVGIGSNHTLNELVGINYRKDKELLDHEWQNGDYAIIQNLVRIFNKFDNSTPGDSAGGDGKNPSDGSAPTDQVPQPKNDGSEPTGGLDDLPLAGDPIDLMKNPAGGG